ncbi:nucleotide-binding universal stress UspA family protein [Streptomyces sp. TE5632]
MPGSDSLCTVTERHSVQFERGTDGPKVIVVGVDGSDSSLRAAAYASGSARRQHALLAVVYVRPVTAAGVALGAPVADATDEITEELVAQVREASERVRGVLDFRWEFHTFRGDPYNGIVKAADELKADAVLVGTSEQAGHRFVGAVAVPPDEGGTPAGDGGALSSAVSEGAQEVEEDLVEDLGLFHARVVSRTLDGDGAAVAHLLDETLRRRGQIGGFE